MKIPKKADESNLSELSKIIGSIDAGGRWRDPHTQINAMTYLTDAKSCLDGGEIAQALENIAAAIGAEDSPGGPVEEEGKPIQEALTSPRAAELLGSIAHHSYAPDLDSPVMR